MSELWRIVLTASVTIAGGVIVYVLGHLFVALFVEPIHRLRSLIGEIADSLVFYADVYSNPGYGQKGIMDEASEVLRRQASQLKARAHSIPCYSFWSFMGLVREKTEIEKASAELIGLSNSVHRSGPNLDIQNYERRGKIEELLGIIGSMEQKESRPINSHMLSYGALLFFFGLILLAVKQTNETPILWFEIPPLPVLVYTILGIVAFLISVIFVVAVFWRPLADKLENFLKEQQRPGWRAIIQYLYFVIFWLVYTVGWLKGLSAISAEELIFGLAFWFGFVWFLIIPVAFLIIPITHKIKARRQRRK